MKSILDGATRLALCATLALGACAENPAGPETRTLELLGDGGVSDFYSWSESLDGAPGQLLRSEAQSEDLALANAASSTRILYTSTDGLEGQGPIIVSGALYIPRGEAPVGGWPLMAWAHGTVGVADVCAPSWAGRSDRDITYLNYWLDQGYAIVASDYQGLGVEGVHPYLAARPEAYSVLDAIRAVQGASFGLSDKVVLFGQSQGGGAAFATAAYAPDYAPEIDIRGSVATGTPYFPARRETSALPVVTRAAFQESEEAPARPAEQPSATLAYAFYGASLMEYLDPSFDYKAYYSERALPVVRASAELCLRDLGDMILNMGLLRSESYSGEPAGEVQAASLALRAYPTVAVPTPVFMGTGGVDRDVPPSMQLSLRNAACAAGTVIEHHLYPEFDHNGAVNGSTPDSTEFVRKAFAGEPISGNCDAEPGGSGA